MDDRNHIFDLGPIPKPKPKLADTVTDSETRFQGENPVINFFHYQRAPKTDVSQGNMRYNPMCCPICIVTAAVNTLARN